MPVEPQPAAARRLLSADAPPHWTARTLAGVKHGFFGRRGGVSTGIYASLNAGTGSNDDAETVRENRRRIAAAFGLERERLVGVHQVHSGTAFCISGPFEGDRPRADALVTTTPGIALSVLTADCTPILFADSDAGVIAAAHAGWKGALGGVIENTVWLMTEYGARIGNIAAAIGPCIHQPSYEVGPEFEARFLAADAGSARFFAPGQGDRRLFDLPGFCATRLSDAGVERIETLPFDTCALTEDFFSNRRAFRSGEPDYGRNCAAVALA